MTASYIKTVNIVISFQRFEIINKISIVITYRLCAGLWGPFFQLASVCLWFLQIGLILSQMQAFLNYTFIGVYVLTAISNFNSCLKSHAYQTVSFENYTTRINFLWLSIFFCFFFNIFACSSEAVANIFSIFNITQRFTMLGLSYITQNVLYFFRNRL